jgi:hypothetical protein
LIFIEFDISVWRFSLAALCKKAPNTMQVPSR